MPFDFPFVVRIELGSSIIVGQRLTLDGILASVLFQRTRDLDIAHTKIPLTKPNGVWAGSAALVEGASPARPISVIQSLRAKLDIDPEMIAPGKRGYPRIETARGNYRNRMSSYLAYDADAIWFSGYGDVDAVRKLIADVPAIGAKRNIGYGKIVNVHFAQTNNEHSGIAFSDGTPARPIPAEVWHSRNGIDCEMALETYCAPYWNGNRVLCALPAHQIVSRKKAAELVGR